MIIQVKLFISIFNKTLHDMNEKEKPFQQKSPNFFSIQLQPIDWQIS